MHICLQTNFFNITEHRFGSEERAFERYSIVNIDAQIGHNASRSNGSSDLQVIDPLRTAEITEQTAPSDVA